MRGIHILAGLLVLSTTSACLTRATFESDPVRITSPNGVVTCQLYTRTMVSWDRAIRHPRNMSLEQADQICINLGHKLLHARQ